MRLDNGFARPLNKDILQHEKGQITPILFERFRIWKKTTPSTRMDMEMILLM